MPPALWDTSLVPEPQPRHGTFTQTRWQGLGAAAKPHSRLSRCHLCAHTDVSAATQDAGGSSSTAFVPPSCLGLACPMSRKPTLPARPYGAAFGPIFFFQNPFLKLLALLFSQLG